jgi:hypothetical protein
MYEMHPKREQDRLPEMMGKAPLTHICKIPFSSTNRRNYSGFLNIAANRVPHNFRWRLEIEEDLKSKRGQER